MSKTEELKNTIGRNEKVDELVNVNSVEYKLAQKDIEIAELKEKLALTEKALKLSREYMFNVMCADDVPFESWFIECAKNDWNPS